MKERKKPLLVLAHHIQAGIKKYEAKEDEDVSYLLKLAGLAYTPYLFRDGRILLVLPSETSAFLYENRDTLIEILALPPEPN